MCPTQNWSSDSSNLRPRLFLTSRRRYCAPALAETSVTTLPWSSFSPHNVLTHHLTLWTHVGTSSWIRPCLYNTTAIATTAPVLPASPLVFLQSHHTTARGAFSKLPSVVPLLSLESQLRLGFRCPWACQDPQCWAAPPCIPAPPHTTPLLTPTTLQIRWNSLHFLGAGESTAPKSWRWLARPFLCPVLSSIFVSKLERRYSTPTILFLTPHLRELSPL